MEWTALYISMDLCTMMPLIMNRKVKGQFPLFRCALTVNHLENEESIMTAETVPKKRLKSILQQLQFFLWTSLLSEMPPHQINKDTLNCVPKNDFSPPKNFVISVMLPGYEIKKKMLKLFLSQQISFLDFLLAFPGTWMHLFQEFFV